jgi:hypothetical protein
MHSFQKPVPRMWAGSTKRVCSLVVAVLLSVVSYPACTTYDSPPRPAIEGLTNGLLSDVKAPLVIEFSEPVNASTLRVKVVRFETDIEGNLFDEDADPATNLEVFARYPPVTNDEIAEGVEPLGEATLSDDRKTLTFLPFTTLPVGPTLAVIVDAGLTDDGGRKTIVRDVIKFGYEFKCSGTKGSKIFPSGTYFFVVNVEKPLGLQVQLLGAIDIDPNTGKFIGAFTNADRNRTQQCPMQCTADEACRMLPAPACVQPSERAGLVDEYPDWVPNNSPPTGYSFVATGCVEDQGDNVAVFKNAPVDAAIAQPPILIKGIELTSEWRVSDDGALRGSGSFIASQVYLGTNASGIGSGDFTARLIPAGEEPPDVPQPPAP